MSVMAAHIRVLRADAKALADVSRETETLSVAHMLMAMADAKARAAAALEAEEPKLREETPVNYNPKGKR